MALDTDVDSGDRQRYLHTITMADKDGVELLHSTAGISLADTDETRDLVRLIYVTVFLEMARMATRASTKARGGATHVHMSTLSAFFDASQALGVHEDVGILLDDNVTAANAWLAYVGITRVLPKQRFSQQCVALMAIAFLTVGAECAGGRAADVCVPKQPDTYLPTAADLTDDRPAWMPEYVMDSLLALTSIKMCDVQEVSIHTSRAVVSMLHNVGVSDRVLDHDDIYKHIMSVLSGSRLCAAQYRPVVHAAMSRCFQREDSGSLTRPLTEQDTYNTCVKLIT